MNGCVLAKIPTGVERDTIVREVLRAIPFDSNSHRPPWTDHWGCKYPGLSAEQLAVLESLGVQADVYYCITPRMKVLLHGRTYKNRPEYLEVDLRDYRAGTFEGCSHEMVQLYWEVGGGGLDNGKPHRYTLCRHCAYSPVLPSLFPPPAQATLSTLVAPIAQPRHWLAVKLRHWANKLEGIES